ncbi:hypothetical protein COCON_G00026730 [Conger conger]|uniref:CRIB domain-containing protein n=1 Tax=Conger conger TaxID=82655 RepID=A0A9Q1DXW0_CONCO|nr:hypothetical protein COCON_G00026730 [Conger conger]
MSLKLPGIKGLVSSSQRKRRFKKDLTADMISPPMGDFRHTMHVGRGGDVFGDTSFLSNHGGTGNGAVADPVDSPSLKTAGFFSRTLRHRELFPSSPRSPEDFTCTYGVESGFATLPRSGTYRSDFRRSSVPDDSILPLLHCDSMTSFTVDLGPSLMSEVFGVIDSPDGGRDTIHSWVDEEKREEEEEKEPCPPSGHATFPASTPVAGSLLREDLNMRGFGSRGREWEELEGDPPRRAIPDVLMGSTARAEPGMEAVRFKMAANVLARHYGSGGLSKGTQETVDWDKRQFSPDTVDSTGCAKRRGPCAYPEEEDEIKV